MLIAAERKGKNARQALAEIAAHAAGEDVALLVVTIMELAHGAARANTAQRKSARQQFIHELIAAVPVHPVSASVAPRAGQIEGESTAKGVTLPLSDLLIAVTALELGYDTVLPPPMCATSRPFPAPRWSLSKLPSLCVLSRSSDRPKERPFLRPAGRCHGESSFAECTRSWSSTWWLVALIAPLSGRSSR